MTTGRDKLYNFTMTKQEFNSIAQKASLAVTADDELFDIVNSALGMIDVLDDYDGDAHEEN